MRKAFLVAAMTLVLLLNCICAFAMPNKTAPGKPAAKVTQDKMVQDKVTEEKPVQVPVIKFGVRGDDVRQVQKLLADSGFYAGEIDGIFGGGTQQAVQEFQASNGLPVDGMVGRDTLNYMQRATSEPSRYSRSLQMAASAYTIYDAGNGNTTYRGHTLRKGLVAVDPNIIPLGTRMYIPGYGYAIADDIGGAIKGNRIDLAYESRSEALEFGRQRVTVYILD